MKISVVMATYNGENHINDQLKSIETQTTPPDEVIISDDASTDSTKTIIKKFIKNSELNIIFLENKKNLGYKENFNLALTRSSGDIIFLCDQDDIWHKKKIETTIEYCKSKYALLYIHDVELIDDKNNSYGITRLQQINGSGFNKHNYVLGSATAIRRELLQLALPIPPKYSSHDKWLSDIATILEKKLIIPEVLGFYRRHSNNVSDSFLNKARKLRKIDLLAYRVKRMKYSDNYFNSNLIDAQTGKNFFYKKLLHIQNNKKITSEEILNIKKLYIHYSNQKEIFEKRNDYRRMSKISKLMLLPAELCRPHRKSIKGIRDLVEDILASK